MDARARWPLADTAFFVDHYGDMSNSELGDRLGKSVDSIKQMAKQFGMRRADGGRLPWPDGGDAILRKASRDGLGKEAVKALFPGIKWRVVAFKIGVLGLRFDFSDPIPPVERLAPEDRIPPRPIDSPEFYTWVRKLYVEHGLSCNEIARIAGTSHVAIWNRVKRMGIECRTTSAPRGTSGVVARNDYIAEKIVDRTKGPVTGYVPKHRLVMEWLLGFQLPDDVVVHHVDGDKHGNGDGNLAVLYEPDHMRYHRAVRAEEKDIEALAGVHGLEGFVPSPVPDDFLLPLAEDDSGYEAMAAVLGHAIPDGFVAFRWASRRGAECLACATVDGWIGFRTFEWRRHEEYEYLLEQEAERIVRDIGAVPIVRKGQGFSEWFRWARIEQDMPTREIAARLGVSVKTAQALLRGEGLPQATPPTRAAVPKQEPARQGSPKKRGRPKKK